MPKHHEKSNSYMKPRIGCLLLTAQYLTYYPNGILLNRNKDPTHKTYCVTLKGERPVSEFDGLYSWAEVKRGVKHIYSSYTQSSRNASGSLICADFAPE